MTAEELRHCAMVKHHPQLMRAFTDLGMDVSEGKYVGAGRAALANTLLATVTRVRTARFLHIVNRLSSAPPRPAVLSRVVPAALARVSRHVGTPLSPP
jgi:hypothetical protein